MSDKKPNFTPIGNGFYVVRTQAGFKQAIKHMFGDGGVNTFSPDSFPVIYPSFICITQGYNGSLYPQVRCIAVNRLGPIIMDL